MHGSKWPFLLAHGSGVVVVDCWDMFCTLGRAPRTKENLLDFREWCRVTRHPRVFHGLTGCQRTPRNWGITGAMCHTPRQRKSKSLDKIKKKKNERDTCRKEEGGRKLLT